MKAEAATGYSDTGDRMHAAQAALAGNWTAALCAGPAAPCGDVSGDQAGRARRPGPHRQVMPAAGSVAFRWPETRARCSRIASIARAGSRARSAATSSW